MFLTSTYFDEPCFRTRKKVRLIIVKREVRFTYQRSFISRTSKFEKKSESFLSVY